MEQKDFKNVKEQIEKQAIEEITNELIFTKNYGTLDAVAKHLYEKGYRKQKWISVDERLPERYETVLVFNYGMISVDFIATNGRWYEHIGHDGITHWMPLPEPPKGGALWKQF